MIRCYQQRFKRREGFRTGGDTDADGDLKRTTIVNDDCRFNGFADAFADLQGFFLIGFGGPSREKPPPLIPCPIAMARPPARLRADPPADVFRMGVAIWPVDSWVRTIPDRAASDGGPPLL